MNQIPSPVELTTSLSLQLASAIMARPVSDDDLQAAALFTLDAVANIVAGRNSVQGRKLLTWQNSMSESSGGAIDQARLSFLYGSLCHILEVDDLHRASVVHPGCVVVPAVFAMAAGTDGKSALTATLRGFEACCRVGMSVGPEHYKIWHNTATCGPFGSAVAVAGLLGLDETACVHAIGNAGSQSAGLWQFLDTGAETKHLHAGRGAEAGVVAATLAAHGFTGAPEILEGDRGFYKATCPDPDQSRLLPGADERWQLHETSIKPWPSCRHTHPAIECALALHRQLRDGGTIRAVRISAYQAALDLCDRMEVETAYAGKFSLQHCVATALIRGAVVFDNFEAEARSEAGDLRNKTSVSSVDEYQSAYPVHWGSRVEVELQDGTVISHAVADARGDPELPLSHDDMVAKARGLLTHGRHPDPERLIEQVLAMPAGGVVPDLSGLMSSAEKSAD
ncbi:MAG: MmgE/PrpD family protein [Pseudomonadota bacterium]